MICPSGFGGECCGVGLRCWAEVGAAVEIELTEGQECFQAQ